jgi:hypothetical protein
VQEGTNFVMGAFGTEGIGTLKPYTTCFNCILAFAFGFSSLTSFFLLLEIGLAFFLTGGFALSFAFAFTFGFSFTFALGFLLAFFANFLPSFKFVF